MAKKKLSHDQKRKQKLARRASRQREEQSSLAYTGNKFKTDALTPVFFTTESAIYEVSEMTEGQLTDRHVRAALEKLVLEMREGPLPPFENRDKPALDESQYADVVVWNIRRRWEEAFGAESHPGRENLIGVLRTLLNSINTWGTPSPHSRGYLKFLQGFLQRAGGAAGVPSTDEHGVESRGGSLEEELLEVGRDWCAGDEEAGEEFRELAEELIDAGRAEKVAEIAQQLIGESVEGGGPIKDLSLIAISAQKKMPPQLGGPG
ncbi:MAG TPA: hypothetical protein VEL76_19800 [Gemmataceae bacterium]|nr:hypothetical protein [Gemmataceae bacterium]